MYKHSVSQINSINAGLKESKNVLFGSNDTILAVVLLKTFSLLLRNMEQA